MPIEMPKGLPFSVDTWTPNSNRKRYHFLTHAHRDHLTGISTHSSCPIYCTRITKSLLRQFFPQIEESVVAVVEVGESVHINDPDGPFTVTAFDANHCPGAVMFLFEGGFGNILHTGDCRLSPDCLESLPVRYIAKKGREAVFQLDFLFLDCTFGRCSLKLPSKPSAVQQVINCIWKHPNAPVVYLACDLLGQEEIFVEVSRVFGSKIFVDRTKNAECFQALSLTSPEIISEDESSRFQVFEGFPRLVERARAKLAEAGANVSPEPLFIRPSTQWYACDEVSESEMKRRPRILSEAEKDEHGIWHVCYSMHSSQEELEWALQLLQPNWVISTTPPCRAMELDYVKKNCFKTKLTSDDPLWKLFNVSSKRPMPWPVSTTSEVVTNNRDSTTVFGRSAPTSAECNQLQLNKIESINLAPFYDLPPLSKAVPLTLFGRARLGPQDYNILLREGKKTEHVVSNSKSKQEAFSMDEGAVVKQVLVPEVVSCAKNVSAPEVISCVKQVVAPEMVSCAKQVSAPKVVSCAQQQVPEVVSCAEQVLSFQEGQEDKVPIHEEVRKDIKEVKMDTSTCIGSSSGFNESLRKLYRGMNVAVPRPLPSLVGLMNVSKRAKFPL